MSAKRNVLVWAFVLVVVAGLPSCAEKQPQVVTSDEGLIMDDLVVGQGAEAGPHSHVDVHYTGWLYDENASEKKGEKFDSSLDRDQHFSVVLGQGKVIKGWDKGIVGMKVGGKRRLTIPYAMAYGERGRGSVIPPKATLIFDVELIGSESLEIINHKMGDGAQAVNGSKVSVDYTGWLYDADALQNKGKKFDSSIDRGQKFSFVLGKQRVITGWDIGVLGMQEGGKRTLIIPAPLAYGKRGSGSIPPDAKLVFDIELFEVDTKELQ